MFLLWEHTVLSLFNYIVFVWLFLLVVLWLPLPDRPAKRTLNMAGFKVCRETRTAAPDWLDSVQARVTRDTHSSRCGPAPAPCPPSVLLKHPPLEQLRAQPPRSETPMQPPLPHPTKSCWEHSLTLYSTDPQAGPSPSYPSLLHWPPSHPISIISIASILVPIPTCPAPHLLSPPLGCPSGPKSVLPTGHAAFIFLCPPCYFKGIPEDAVRLGCGLVGLFVFVLEVL